jgi:endonuclease-3
VQQIDELIHTYAFHRAKAQSIHSIAKYALREHKGTLPADRELLLELSGVGRKCANLAIGVSTGEAIDIPVDIHVHRVANRWGVVSANTPERTMEQLQEILPRSYWLEINKLLVPFGKHVCRVIPRCPHCPLLSMCRQVEVNKIDPTPVPATDGCSSSAG